MSLVNFKEMLFKAQNEHYAVPSFDLLNLDIIRPVIETAQGEKAPVIIAALENGLRSTGTKPFADTVRYWAEQVTVPVALHLDHGRNIEIIKECLDAGFTSVMFDGSHLPLAENIALVNKVIEVARPYGATVEAELGKVPGIEGGKSVKEEEETFTEVSEAVELCASTGVDALAVSIGTIHCMLTRLLNPNIKLLEEIRSKVDTPLVLHGGAAVTEFTTVEMVQKGITKYNINYKINKPFLTGLALALATWKEEVAPGKLSVSPPKVMEEGHQMIAVQARYFYKLLGCAGKANS